MFGDLVHVDAQVKQSFLDFGVSWPPATPRLVSASLFTLH